MPKDAFFKLFVSPAKLATILRKALAVVASKSIRNRSLSSTTRSMAKSKSKGVPDEKCLVLPRHNDIGDGADIDLIDTHTHVISTYETYRSKYAEGKHQSVREFVQGLLLQDESHRVSKVVDVWCEAPLKAEWRDTVEQLSSLEDFAYHFVVGAHPHEAKDYNDELEATFKEAHAHPACVGWGEIGLDYHYDNSPRDVQQQVLRRQLRAALQSGQNKAITIHTREADDDIWTILTEEVSREQRLHIHCFTDSPALAHKLLDHFPNLCIGITGVVSYSSNLNTAQVIRDMGANATPQSPEALRILLETDAPFMTPANMGPPTSLGMKGGQKMPFSHSGMLPWTAAFVAQVLNEGISVEEEASRWTTQDVLKVARENAKKVYGI